MIRDFAILRVQLPVNIFQHIPYHLQFQLSDKISINEPQVCNDKQRLQRYRLNFQMPHRDKPIAEDFRHTKQIGDKKRYQ